MNLKSSVIEIKGVGSEVAKKMSILGIETVEELIDLYPRRYDDYSEIQKISLIRPGIVTINATIKSSAGRYVKRGLHITEAVASDSTGSVRLVWFNQPYRSASLKTNEDYYISGEFGMSYQRLNILNPSVELVSNFPVNTARIVPIYRETKGLKSGQIRRALREVFPIISALPETLPKWLVEKERMLSRAEAIEQIHFPGNQQELITARRRLGFDEVFELTLAALINKLENSHGKSIIIPFEEKLAKDFVKHLPFILTDDQKRVIWQIYKDIQKQAPMNRLIEGDVGSGKTVVAVMASLMVVKKNFQVAFMAPTEILARQHADSIHALLKPLGMHEQIVLLVGGQKPAQKLEAKKRISSGDAKIIVGTHALIQNKVNMQKLGLVIIDEQHRFGVEQRKRLLAKAGHMPHVLSMTATPIPRSLALTLYGELDISVIESKPANRKDIITKIIPLVERHKIFDKLENELKSGRQAFVVCPLITITENNSIKSVEQVYDELSTGPFSHRKIGLLHGKLKSEAKDIIMQSFLNHKIDILVTTTVIEVGVDVPNATIMMIENPEKFGLAQLHQLRGRVGRSKHQSFCYLLLNDNLSPSHRLRLLERSTDGFKLAEYDLELRGPGAIYGQIQHGQLDLRVAKLSDTKLIAKARLAAQEFIDRHENLLIYQQLNERVQFNRSVTNLN